MNKDRSRSRSRESGEFSADSDAAADLRAKAATMADCAWIMSGFELSADPLDKTMPEDNEEPPP